MGRRGGKRKVVWVTQLVVHSEYRERGLAKGLLSRLVEDDEGGIWRETENGDGDREGDGGTVYGIMSTHPGACRAAARVFGGKSSLSLSPDFVLATAPFSNIILFGSLD